MRMVAAVGLAATRIGPNPWSVPDDSARTILCRRRFPQLGEHQRTIQRLLNKCHWWCGNLLCA